MARLVIAPTARADLREIRSYVARDDPTAARKLIERLQDQARRIAATPGMGRGREDLRPGLRSFAVGNYILFYRILAGGIELARVIHGARDLPALFAPED